MSAEPWSPFRGEKRSRPAPRSRGRRRQRLQAAPDDPDAILTDRDAARAAEIALHDRMRPAAPAWERFGSQPVNPPKRERDLDDRILRLADAQRDQCGLVVPADTSRREQMLRTARPAHDYGTGHAYDISAMS